MSIPNIKPGEVLSLALGNALQTTKTTTLVKSDELEVIRLVVPGGKQILPHKAPGPITVPSKNPSVTIRIALEEVHPRSGTI